MSLAKLSISRHALTISLSFVIIVLGILAYFRIGIDRHPNVDLPALSISTALPGMSSQNIASTITQPLEAKLNTISGIDTLASSSITGLSVITATFHAGTNMTEALNELESRISQARGELPADAKPPVVQKFALNSHPVLWMTLSGKRSQQELTSLAEVIRKRIEPMKGIGEVQLRGTAEKILQIIIDDGRLAALNLSYSDIESAFKQNHLNSSGGRLKTDGREYQVDLNFEYSSPADLRNLAISEQGHRVIRLGEIAEIIETIDPNRNMARHDGQTTVALGVVKASGSNPVELIHRVKEKVNGEFKSLLPPDVELKVITEEAKPIQQMVEVLKSHLMEGTLLTAVVIWLFLQSLRATSIIATAIPVSLLGAIAALYLFGFTLNSFTLLALLLLIGVVVDDAIVVLENIYRIKENQPELAMHDAAERGTSEVMFAVMAATLTLACIFGPVVFLPGVLGQYLTSFSVTVVVGLLVSWFVSMTLTPMLCARYLQVNPPKNALGRRLQDMFHTLEKKYLSILSACLLRPTLTLLAACIALIPTWFMARGLNAEFTPQVDEGRISIQVSLPHGHGKQKIQELALLAEAQLLPFPEVAATFTSFEDGNRNGGDVLSLLVLLKEQRTRSQQEMIARLQKQFSAIPGWRATVQPATGIGSSKANGAPLHFYLLGPDYTRLQELAHSVHLKLSAPPAELHLNNDLNSALPQLTANINAGEAARLGITAQDISRAIAVLNGQLTIGRYTADDGQRYNIMVASVRGIQPATMEVFENIKLRSRSGHLIPLSTVVHFQPKGAAASLQRVNQQYAVTFFGNPSHSLGEAIAAANQIQKELPPGYSILFSGQSEEMRKSRPNMVMVFGFGILLLYLVLASQFNSFSQPFLIMLAQPFAMIGGIGALAMTGQTFNVYSMIGLLLLMGLVTKNSILLVDRTNQLIAKGLPIQDALKSACPERLRPVLMTSITVVLALLPAAFGFEVGSENNQPLSIAVIGGMVSSTLLTLLVIPAAHSLISGQANRAAEPENVFDRSARNFRNRYLPGHLLPGATEESIP